MGEVLRFANEHGWGEGKLNMLGKLVGAFSLIESLFYEVSEAYAALGTFARKSGFVCGANDLWIASIALVNNFTVLTYDKDFQTFQKIVKVDLLEDQPH